MPSERAAVAAGRHCVASICVEPHFRVRKVLQARNRLYVHASTILKPATARPIPGYACGVSNRLLDGQPEALSQLRRGRRRCSGVVIAVSIYGMNRLASAHHVVSLQATPSVLAADAARSAASDAHFSQTQYVVDPATHSDFLGDKATLDADLARLAKVTDTNERTEYNGIRAAYGAWLAGDAKLWSTVKAGDLEGAPTRSSSAARTTPPTRSSGRSPSISRRSTCSRSSRTRSSTRRSRRSPC